MDRDQYWNNVVLAMHMDDTGLTDAKGHPITIYGNAARSEAQSKFGGYSAYFDGTGDYLTTPASSDFTFGSSGFTIEAWIYPTNSTAEQGVFTRWSSVATSNEALFFGVRPNGVLVLLLTSNGLYQSANDFYSASGVIAYNAWNHIACCRSGDNIYLFVNGVVVKTATFSGSIFASTLVGSVGASTNAANAYFGYIDDLRVTKGIARYTANFTPPAAEFPSKMVQIAGVVRDSSDAFVAKPVHVHRQSDGALAGVTTSNAITGAFSVSALDTTEHYATCIYSNTEPAITIHNIIPV